MSGVQRFASKVPAGSLAAALRGDGPPEQALPGSAVPLEPLLRVVNQSDPEWSRTEMDQWMVSRVHRALPLSRRQAADARVWHWLCVRAAPEFVWRRWGDGVIVPALDVLDQHLTTALGSRFLGGSSLNGVSRNALARLWWTAESLRDGDDYALAELAFARQDAFQAIFERFFGLHDASARACLDRFRGRPPGEMRAAAVWLQQFASTTVLEVLDVEQVCEVLDLAFDDGRPR